MLLVDGQFRARGEKSGVNLHGLSQNKLIRIFFWDNFAPGARYVQINLPV